MRLATMAGTVSYPPDQNKRNKHSDRSAALYCAQTSRYFELKIDDFIGNRNCMNNAMYKERNLIMRKCAVESINRLLVGQRLKRCRYALERNDGEAILSMRLLGSSESISYCMRNPTTILIKVNCNSRL